MNDELSPEARSILDAARGGDDPTPHDKNRIRRGVLAAVGGGAALASSTATSTAAAATTGGGFFGGGIALKVTTAVFLVGAVTTAAVVQPWEPADEPPEEAPVPAPVPAPAVPVADEPEPAPFVTEPPVPIVDEALPEVEEAHAEPVFAPPEQPRPVEPLVDRVPSSSAGQDEPEPAEAGTLADEVALLRAAQRARAEGDASRALGHLDEHAARFPDGLLSAERRVTRALSLCDLGRVDEARRIAEPMITNPASPYAQRLSSSCVGER